MNFSGGAFQKKLPYGRVVRPIRELWFAAAFLRAETLLFFLSGSVSAKRNAHMTESHGVHQLRNLDAGLLLCCQAVFLGVGTLQHFPSGFLVELFLFLFVPVSFLKKHIGLGLVDEILVEQSHCGQPEGNAVPFLCGNPGDRKSVV